MPTEPALAASSITGIGVRGARASKTRAATLGLGYAKGTGGQGHSGTGANIPAAPLKTGVVGSANQDAGSVGVKGLSAKGRGVVAAGGAAQLRRVPSKAATHPGGGMRGDLFVDSKWFCKGGAVWVKLA